MTGLFTIENSRLAALVHGDPNEIHKIDRFGKIIAPGLMQLQGFLSMSGWKEGHILEVLLKKAVVVPNLELDYSIKKDGSYVLSDGDNIYSQARIFPAISMPNFSSDFSPVNYSFTNEDLTLNDSGWENYSKIPISSVKRIMPLAQDSIVYRAAAVGVGANALVRLLKENPSISPDLFFPVVRENGENACLEEKLCLYMGRSPDFETSHKFSLQAVPPKQNLDSRRGIIGSIVESFGLYALDIYLTKIPLRTLNRVLK
ncbi:MAG: hypothetical protein WC979_04185 [Candidatus Pacearchaeota archaeon]|jgi:hypothetical protein